MRTILLLLAFVLFCPSAFAQKPEPKYKGKSLADWVERLQKGETDKDQEAAAAAIITFGPEAASVVPILIEMLNDRSDDYRHLVMQILDGIGPAAKGAVPELVKRLKERHALKPSDEKETENNTNEMLGIIMILGSIGPDAKEAVPTIAVCLESMKESFSWWHSIEQLCKIGPAAKELIPAIRRVILLSIAQHDDPSSCVRGLQKLGTDVIPLLLDLLSIPDKSTQEQAFRELKEFDTSVLNKSEQLERLLKDRNPVARYYAARLVWWSKKDHAAISVLTMLLKDDGPLLDTTLFFPGSESYGSIGEAAAESLGGIGPDANDAIRALEEAVASGFVSWYFVGSRKDFPPSKYRIWSPYGSPTSKPESDSECYERVHRQMEIGDAANKAIRKIRPQTESGKKSPGP